MTTTLSSPPAPIPQGTDAISYKRAHTGKLMVIARAEGREPSFEDFFQFDSVGTHPTGLLVTGIFDDGRRHHMNASLIRDANQVEISRHLNRPDSSR